MAIRACQYPFDIREALTTASENIRGSWEQTFVGSLQQEYERHEDQMFLSEKQAKILCRIAHIDWDGTVEGQEEPKRERKQRTTRPPPEPEFETDLLKRLLHLCHPDKHGGSKMATEVTAKLLKMRG